MIDIYELNKTRDLRFQRRIETYKVFLKRCLQKIKSLSSEREFCTYQVPLLAAGVPLFDRKKCIFYIYHKLIHTGFKVYYLENMNLFIFWGHIPSYISNPQLKYENSNSYTQNYNQYESNSKNNYRDINDINRNSNFIYDLPKYKNKINDLL